MEILDWPLLTREQRQATDAQFRSIGWRPLNGTVDFTSAGIPDYEIAGSPGDTENQYTTSILVTNGGGGPPVSPYQAAPRSPSHVLLLAGVALAALWWWKHG